MTSALLQPQFSCKASRKLGQQQLGIHARFTSSCSSLVPWVPKQSPLLECFRCTRQRHHGPAVLVTAKMDMRVMVKLSVARSSGKLDLSNCGLTEVPAEVCDLRDLQELSLAGNELTELPDSISKLQSLERLQLSGNRLQQLPDSICQLTSLQGFWAHGNFLASLPADFGKLVNLHTISLAGNKLANLPKSLSGLVKLRDLGLQGNELSEVPAEMGALSSLLKLTMNGNHLTAVAPECGQLTNLRELHLQGNQLTELPSQLYQLMALEVLSVADNHLHTLHPGLSSLTSLKQFWAYGNHLQTLPADLLHMPAIQNIWVEGNPLQPQPLVPLLLRLAKEQPPELRELGLDADQVHGIEPRIVEAAQGVRVGKVCGHGVGYFKLHFGDAHLAENSPQEERLLVVAFSSAPGLPNWGGLLKKVYDSMTQPAHRHFDTLYVVDPTRSWYHGGDEQFHNYFDRLREVTRKYKRVVMLGDSMGATAALLFSALATAVQAFSPQVDLNASSIRPAFGTAEMTILQERLIQQVSESSADITVHVSSWEHDTDQGTLLPQDKVNIQIYSFADHRLAFYLDEINQLELLVKDCMLVQQGFKAAAVALAI